MSLRDQLLGIRPRIQSTIIDGIGLVHIREWTDGEFNRLRKELMNKAGEVNQEEIARRYIIAAICDENGELQFQSSDLETLKNMPAKIAMKLFRAIQDANNIMDADSEELVKKSETTTNSGCGIA